MCGITNKPVSIGREIPIIENLNKDKIGARITSDFNKGSEAVYQTKDGEWHTIEITDKSGLALHSKDSAAIDKKTLEKQVGASPGTLELHFVEDDGGPPTPPEMLKELAEGSMLAKILKENSGPPITPEMVKELAKGSYPDSGPPITPEMVKELAKGSYPDSGPPTPLEILRELAKDPDPNSIRKSEKK